MRLLLGFTCYINGIKTDKKKIKENMITLIVLDFTKKISYVYTLKERLTDNDIANFLKKNNHKVENCTWMLTNNKIIEIDK